MEHPFTEPGSVCRCFDRADWSLIEEPSVCELCRYFEEEKSLCLCPARQEE